MNWGQAFRNWGQLGGHVARGAWGSPTGRGAILGAGWGLASDNTSVLGGALMGAGIGRYGAAAARQGYLGWRGIGTSVSGARGALYGVGKGMWNRARMDYRGTRMMANQGYSKIRSTLGM